MALTSRRAFVWTDPLGSAGAATPVAGGRIDGVAKALGGGGLTPIWAAPGKRVVVDLAASVTDGDDLAVDGTGQFLPATSGDMIVARALEAESSGGTASVAFETQRTA